MIFFSRMAHYTGTHPWSLWGYTKWTSGLSNTYKIVVHSSEQVRSLFEQWWIAPLLVTKYPPNNREKPYERQTALNGVCVDGTALSRLTRNDHTALWVICYLKILQTCWTDNAFAVAWNVFVLMEVFTSVKAEIN